MITNGDHEEPIFLLLSHTSNGFFFVSCSLLNTAFFYFKRFPEIPAYAEMFLLFVLLLSVTVKSYSHGGTVSSPDHTFPGQA